MNKDTSKIVEELGMCDDFHTFYDKNQDYMTTASLSELLKELEVKCGIKKHEIIKRSELSEIYAYQIFSGRRLPDRKKLLCLAVGMMLNIDDVQRLLKCAGYPPLYAKRPFDSVVMYGIMNQLTIIEINKLLFEYGSETLG